MAWEGAETEEDWGCWSGTAIVRERWNYWGGQSRLSSEDSDGNSDGEVHNEDKRCKEEMDRAGRTWR